jgi:hypothetical protein
MSEEKQLLAWAENHFPRHYMDEINRQLADPRQREDALDYVRVTFAGETAPPPAPPSPLLNPAGFLNVRDMIDAQRRLDCGVGTPDDAARLAATDRRQAEKIILNT